jgi:hypothetical protein
VPPNMRVQWTPSSPSDPHSPVTRWPFGSTIGAVVLQAALAWLSVACIGMGDMDPFRMTFRSICGDIQLREQEDNFYLTDRKKGDEGIGVGRIEKIGWGHGSIVLKNVESARVGDPAGWFIVDCQTKSLVGPLSDAQAAASPEVQRVKILDVREAWSRLSKH